MNCWFVLVVSAFGQLQMRDVVIYGLLDEKIARERVYFFDLPQSDYELASYIDYQLRKDIEKQLVVFPPYPSILVLSGFGTSPSGLIGLSVQSNPAVDFKFSRGNNPLSNDNFTLNLQESNYGAVGFTHEYYDYHFTSITAHTGLERFKVRAFSTWLDTGNEVIINPSYRNQYGEFQFGGSIDFGSAFNYHLNFRYAHTPFCLIINYYNPIVETPLFIRPEAYLNLGSAVLYFRSGISNLYLDDIYKLNHFVNFQPMVREKVGYDFGLGYQGVNIGYVFYDSLPYFLYSTTSSNDTVYQMYSTTGRFGYISVHKELSVFEIIGRFEVGTDILNRNQGELDLKLNLPYRGYKLCPILRFYHCDEIKHRFDFMLEKNILGLFNLRFGLINILDRQFVQPEDYLDTKRELFGQIEAKL